MKRVFVTGANGFVGHVLVTALRDSAGWGPVAGMRAESAKDPGVPVAVHGSVEAVRDWAPFLGDVDAVIHLANRAHVMDAAAADALARYRAVNVTSTRRLAAAAVSAGVKRFIYVSSIKVNGERTEPGQPFRACDKPVPEDAYGQSKWEAEEALFEVAEGTGMEVVIVRPPLVYGAGVKGNLARLIGLVERGIPLPLGAVSNARSMVALENLVDLLVRCLDHPAAAGRTFLVSDGKDLSTPELVRLMAEAMGRSPRLVPVPVGMLRFAGRLTGKAAEVERLCGSLRVDDSETRRVLDWAPPVSVEEGIRRMVEGRVSARRPAPGNRG